VRYLNNFQNIEPTLRWRPDFVDGMPVAGETRRLALVTPNCRFQLHPPLFMPCNRAAKFSRWRYS
jgi:hypothetical protein